MSWLKTLRQSKLMRWLRYVGQQLQNQRMNRQLVGQDRDGNKYYQYYSYYGLPTRREIRFKIQGDWEMRDLVYYRWLYKFEFDPPTECEKQQLYREKLRYERAAEWDRKQALLMEEFRARREELLLRNAALKELADESAKEVELEIKSRRA